MEEDPDFELGEEKSIVLRVPKPMPPPKVKSAASIEARLREMQRKLSEIAEIPKILSSTLATVSQTFEKLNPSELKQQYRKHSYDEDALDYELSGATTAAVTANGERRLKLKAKGKANSRTTTSPARGSGGEKLYLAKDPTPESDYASEGNYESNEADTDDDDYVYDGDVGESGGSGAFDVGNRKYKNSTNTSVRMAAELVANDKEACVAFVTRMRPVKSSKQQQQERKQYQQHQYRDNVNVSEELEDDLSTTEDEAKDCDVDEDEVEAENSDDDVVTARLAVDGVSGSSDDDDDEVDDVGDDDDDDENDFLTATYTWSLSKIPKLRLNDEKQSDDESSTFKDQIDMNDTDEEKPNKKARWCHTDDDDAQHEKPVLWAEDADEKEKKFADKLERSWPWADREKIIYKQSTCHLVRRRPLGLVEQRIKLLAKQNLSDSLERQLQH
ncbi:transcription initiation factor TFIID subunit 11 isoform X2 [Ceratitis capitata]|nr:transcription initiation factor TFIID subunit 11 isoform X2 [Ceratitis capitata]